MDTVNAIALLFILIALGALAQYILQKKRSWSEQLLCSITRRHCSTWIETLNKFVLYLALPALIFSSLYTIKDYSSFTSLLFLVNIALLAIFVLVLYGGIRLFRPKTEVANAYLFGGFFGNVAYIGFPFVTTLIPESAGEVSILVGLHVLVGFTLGLYILERSKHRRNGTGSILKNLVRNPLLLAVLLGLLISFLRLPLPTALTNAISLLGNSASPVVLIALGMFMFEQLRSHKQLLHGFMVSIIKIILLPLFFLAGIAILKIPGNFTVSILEAAMPVALTNFALAEIYPMDKRIIASAIAISTLLGLVTLSLFSIFL